ncbi:hypothetical protein HMPREF0322_03343, partial [Desulfitobacterium hafniense DP7]
SAFPDDVCAAHGPKAGHGMRGIFPYFLLGGKYPSFIILTP